MALVGRDVELAAIDEAVASARAGRGRAVFVTGEAGLGKSALLAAAAARCAGTVLMGAAWESPGAPPYWPWIQVMRAAVAQCGAHVQTAPGAAAVGRLLDDDRHDLDELAIDAAAARFALIDAVARTLIELASQQPLVILLDDLHAADLPSLELLDLLGRELPRAAIAVVGAWREPELASRPEAARRMSRVCRRATVLPLRPLTLDEVTRWVGDRGAASYGSTEGNPLFVEEMMRSGGDGRTPAPLATVLEDHLALVSDPTRDVLRAASVLGREIDPEVLRAMLGVDASIDAALHEAGDAGLGGMRTGRWVFGHILLRDHLYRSLSAHERASLHQAAGAALQGRSLTGAAFHLLAGTTGDQVGPAIDAARRAAMRALQVHAFEDAASLLAAAVRTLDASRDPDRGLQIDLQLELATARHGAGDHEAGQAETLGAVERARLAGDAERFARAALVYGHELVTGQRAPVMVDLLEQARTMLPPTDSPTLARVTARLAAALVPSPDPREHRSLELADHAVAMARRLGDDETCLSALRYASHARGFRATVDEAMPGALEVIGLADRLGRPLEALEHRTWLVNAHLARGDLDAADAATSLLGGVLARLPQPHYRWRLPIVRATRAVIAGDLDDAARLTATVRQLAREHDLDRARMCATFSGLSLAFASRRPDHAAAIKGDVHGFARRTTGPIGASFLAGCLAIAGELELARAELARITFIPPVGLMQLAAEAALIVGDLEFLARAIAPLTIAAKASSLAYGPSMSLCLCPLEIVIGEILLRLDRADEAVAPIERGLRLARALGARPYIPRGALALAAALEARGHDAARVRALRDEARPLAPSTGPVSMPEPGPAPPPRLEILGTGDRVTVRWRQRELDVPAGKGLGYLAALLARPDGEIHVSELTGDDDRGDAGEILDAEARAAYRARCEDLQDQLEVARTCNDLGRIDRLSMELDAITDQLVAATGLGGRSRRAGSRVERSRVNVQRRIRDAIRRLGEHDDDLRRYLDATIRTGTFCSYSPFDPT